MYISYEIDGQKGADQESTSRLGGKRSLLFLGCTCSRCHVRVHLSVRVDRHEGDAAHRHLLCSTVTGVATDTSLPLRSFRASRSIFRRSVSFTGGKKKRQEKKGMHDCSPQTLSLTQCRLPRLTFTLTIIFACIEVFPSGFVPPYPPLASSSAGREWVSQPNFVPWFCG